MVRLSEVESSVAAPGDHLGLGFYIVREIVSAHGGKVWAESVEGGTAFQVALPLYAPSLKPVARL